MPRGVTRRSACDAGSGGGPKHCSAAFSGSTDCPIQHKRKASSMAASVAHTNDRGHVMKKSISGCLLLLLLTFPPIGSAATPSRYLFVWAMEAKRPQASTQTLMSPDLAAWRSNRGLGKDFLAVFDVRPGASFGKLLAMLPVGNAAMAHHTNYAEPPNDLLYANDWIANQTYVFDLRNPRYPRLMRKFGSIGAYGYPHSFAHLANGNTLATFQYSGGFNYAAGGL